MPEGQPRKIVDIMAPSVVKPTSTSRPVIVNNQPTHDSTIKRPSEAAPLKSEVVSPVFSEATKKAYQPRPTTPPAQLPKFGSLQAKIDAHPLFSGAKEPAPKKPKKWAHRLGWILMLLLVIAAALYILMDAGIINTNINLPFHIFKQGI